jgi:hypothetical protein
MKMSLIKTCLLTLFTLVIVSCGDSPFLSKDEPSNQTTGISGISSYSKKLILDGLEVIPRYTDKVKLYENNSINLIFMNEFGELKDPSLTLHLMLWMPDHGHGSFPIELTKTSSGVYKADKVFFTMPGYWDLHLQLKDGDKVIEEVLWPITL